LEPCQVFENLTGLTTREEKMKRNAWLILGCVIALVLACDVRTFVPAPLDEPPETETPIAAPSPTRASAQPVSTLISTALAPTKVAIAAPTATATALAPTQPGIATPPSRALASATAAPLATATRTATALAPTATRTSTSASGCPPVNPGTIKTSAYVKSVTLATGAAANTYEPINPTTTFARTAIIHAIVAIQNAPTDTLFKVKWYANDVGTAASCNTFVDEAELREDGTKNIDYTLGAPNPVGTYRAEIYVNGNLHQVVTFTIR
jgi:hypothetical protein